jgi:cell division protein FtsI/penicillin-binding protein 2
MSPHKNKWKQHVSSGRMGGSDWRTKTVKYGMLVFAGIIMGKLFILQVLDHSAYQALASGQHEIFKELFPERGDILIHDLKDETVIPLATNQQLAFVYADPRNIEDPDATAEALADLFGFSDEKTDALEERLKVKTDPYEPIQRNVLDAQLDRLVALELPGIHYVREAARLYPEPGLGGHVVGFVGSAEDGTLSGKYGIEGYFNEELTGMPGFLRSERDIAGRLIAIGEHSIEPAVDGSDILLTLDRTIQYVACSKLHEAVAKHAADGGSVVVMEPSTGRVLAMCGAPDFDPANFRDVASIDVFNNPAIFKSYEPGSIFKSVTMAAAMDKEAVSPTTMFEDTGSVMVDGWPKPITNAEGKSYGLINMTQVLEDSVNTGMIFSMRAMGMESFTQYVKDFGFGERTGIELETESPGDVSSLDFGQEVYAATASFGQGITTTVLQMASAYAALANGGILMQPMIVDEIRRDDGTVEVRKPKEIRRVLETKTARLIGAMLVSVVEYGHGKRAGVPGYYIGGKTGTAQIARTDGLGYQLDATIGSFAGFGPVNNPKFAMVVRIDHPRDVQWAESTAAPLFGEIAKFLLQYFEVPPERPI